MRTVTIADKKLRELLQKRGIIVAKGRMIDTERLQHEKKEKELASELNKLALQLQKIDGQATEIIEKKNISLVKEGKVYEKISGAAINKDKIDIQIVDKIEEYLESLNSPKKEEKK